MFGVVHGEIWGDEYIIAAISHMWNISISIILSGYSNEWKLFHDRELAHIENGYRFRARQKATHLVLQNQHYSLPEKLAMISLMPIFAHAAHTNKGE